MTTYKVPEMTCGHCKKTVEEALHRIDAKADIKVDLEKHEIALASAASSDQVLAALKAAGYDATMM